MTLRNTLERPARQPPRGSRRLPVPRGGAGRAPLAVLPVAASGEATMLKAVAALLAFALIAALILLLRQWLALRRARRAVGAAEASADHAVAVMTGAPGSFWSWPVRRRGDDRGLRGPGLAGLLGASPSALENFSDVLDRLERADAGRLTDAVKRLCAGGAAFTLRVATAGGKRHLEARGARGTGANGEPLCDTVWFRDVTDTTVESTRLMERVSALAAQNTDFRHMLDGLGLPVWARGADLALAYCNRAYARAVDEVAPASAVAAGREIAGGPTGWGRRLAEEARASGAPVTRSLHVVVDGARRLLEITELPVGGAGGGWRVAGFAVDRTDTAEARAELSRHMDAHAAVLEKLGTGIVVYGPDTRLEFHNTAFARMWDLDPEWLRARPTHGEVLEELRARRAYPEQTDFQEFKRESMELYTSLIEPQEELIHLPDERVFRQVINPHPLGGLLFTFEDVTDRLTLERSYNTLIAVQSETLDNLHEGVVVFGSDGRLKLFNPAYARIWGLDPDMLEDQPRVADVIDAAAGLFRDRGDWEGLRQRLLTGVADRTARAGRFERTDGSILDYAAVPLPDGAMLFSYIDVTDSVAVQRALRERNEALLDADRLKSEFITNVSYELRTPLNTIIGFTEILSNQYFGTLNRRQAEYARGILEASQHLLSLIDDILDLALVESGRLELERGRVEIPAMLNAVAALARKRARKQGIALELDCPEGIGPLVADERRLKQALFNLVSNAVKYTPPGGRITLAVRPAADGGAAFAVSDTGPGIPEEDRERVFERFERGTGQDPRPHGVGLGLALVKSFIELHGGVLTLDSRIGEGTTVRFTVPAEAPPPAPDSATEMRPDL